MADIPLRWWFAVGEDLDYIGSDDLGASDTARRAGHRVIRSSPPEAQRLAREIPGRTRVVAYERRPALRGQIREPESVHLAHRGPVRLHCTCAYLENKSPSME
ncbi:hypothetical protein [Hamadaea tsunoensis]|nr:hypothetical protein [Hamadaea tsunoensis]